MDSHLISERPRCLTLSLVFGGLERAMGIEPTAQAWEAWVLPLYDARAGADSNKICASRRIAGALWLPLATRPVSGLVGRGSFAPSL